LSGSAIERLRAAFGPEPYTSRWLDVAQSVMDQFSEATRDPDWMHVDPERAAREGPFDGTIAFGFWTMSMLTFFLREWLGAEYPPGALHGFNYGFDRVRLMSPVPVGSRIRCRMDLRDVAPRGPGRFRLHVHAVVEVEGKEKPAMVADWLVFMVYPELTGHREP
jgi:acyl dehydratase